MKATPTLALAATLAACSPGNPVIDETGGDTEWIYDCEGDNDGVIQFDELPWATGVSVPYVANQAGDSVSVQPHGEDVDGTTVWDFSQAPGVLSVDLDLLDPSEQWFASHFPDASYATPLFVHDLDLLGVISAEEEGFVLQGLVSREEAPELGQTLVVYEDPIATYTFPLELGTTWLSTTSFRDALIYGVPNAGEEHYLFEVDAVGTLLLPGYTLETCCECGWRSARPSWSPLRTIRLSP